MKYHRKNIQYDEANLIRELKNDSVQAFNALYEMYFRRVYAYCHQFTKSHKDAEDMVQEIFMKLWTSRHGITAENSLQLFIYRIARNGLISSYRANIHSPHYEEYLNYRDTLGAEDHSPMEFEEFKAKVNACIDSLPPSQGRILRMSRFAMMSVEEIAHELNIGEQTVRNQLSSALRAMRKLLLLLIMLLLNFG